METSFTSVGVFALLGLGLMFGLKHATEVDHVVAVSAIVSEHRNVLRSALVGGLWGAGHTASLVIVGVLVLVFRVAIPLPVANWLEFGVALMIVGLGVRLSRLRVPSPARENEHARATLRHGCADGDEHRSDGATPSSLPARQVRRSSTPRQTPASLPPAAESQRERPTPVRQQ